MSSDTLKLLAILVIGGCSLIVFAIRKHRSLRRIIDHPTVRIQTCAQGLSEFQGFAWPKGDGLVAFGEFELVYYSLVLEKKITTGSGKHRQTTWVKEASFYYNEPFFVVDATGLAEVDSASSEISVESQRIRNWAWLQQAEKDYLSQNFLNSFIAGFPPSNFLFGIFSTSFRIVEKKIPVGSPIYAKGSFASLEAMGKKVVLTGLTKFSAQVFDHKARKIRDIKSFLDTDRNGIVSLRESQQGYARLAQFARRQSTQGISPIPDKEVSIFGTLNSTSDQKLLIADCHEIFLKRRYQLQFYQMLFVGLAMIIAAAFVWTYSKT